MHAGHVYALPIEKNYSNDHTSCILYHAKTHVNGEGVRHRLPEDI